MPEGQQAGDRQGSVSGMPEYRVRVARAGAWGCQRREQVLTDRVNAAKVACMILSANERTNGVQNDE
jgi:hypothetical protein